MAALHYLSKTANVADMTETYRLIPQRTSVRLHTTHLLGLARVVASVRLISGHAVVTATGVPQEVSAELDMTSFASASAARDRAVASPRFLDSATHSRAAYHATDFERRPGGWLAHGTLTAKGVPAGADLLIDVPADADPAAGVRLPATATVHRPRHRLPVPGAIAGRAVHIRHDTHLDPAATGLNPH